MAKISAQLLNEEVHKYYKRGPTMESFGSFLNKKYDFSNLDLEKVKSIEEAVAIVRKKHVKKI
jgi:hypothetical protein|tara:strand:- start:910 stop:1098 length:189 start_codon:yes stop_codon:yes gene_type:complete